MAKEKLFRYEAINHMPNVIQMESKDPAWVASVKGTWSTIFGNDRPITLELACGKGDYALEMARRFPDRNFIGVDLKGDRIFKGATIAQNEGLSNIRFLRIYIDHIENYFAPGEVADIWITFPDPYLNEQKKNKRLTAPVFLDRYRSIMGGGGTIHFKTDDPTLDEFTMEVISQQEITPTMRIEDVHRTNHGNPLLDIITFYESKHLQKGLRIRYTKFELKSNTG